MIIGSVTMSIFGWCTLGLEIICIFLKSCYVWKDSMVFSHGISKKAGLSLVWGVYLLTQCANEYGGLSGETGVAQILFPVNILLLYFLTENGLEIMGRNLLYWLLSYEPFIILESVTALPGMAEGSTDYYQTPERILPNLLFLLLAFFLMLVLWNRKILHRIPAGVCVTVTVFGASVEFIRSVRVAGKQYVTWADFCKIAGIVCVYTMLVIGLLLFYSIRQRQKTKIAETCRRQFYEQISKIQHEAGKFRHDLANHMQVINRYRQEEQKSRQYQQKLRQRKAELETVRYSGNKRMDFILEQIRQLALARGCELEIRWEADKKEKLKNEIPKEEQENKCMTEEYIAGKNDAKKEGTDTAESTTEESISEKEMEDLTDRCLEAVASRSLWWIAGKYSGKKIRETLRIFRKDGTLHGKIRRR